MDVIPFLRHLLQSKECFSDSEELSNAYSLKPETAHSKQSAISRSRLASKRLTRTESVSLGSNFDPMQDKITRGQPDRRLSFPASEKFITEFLDESQPNFSSPGPTRAIKHASCEPRSNVIDLCQHRIIEHTLQIGKKWVSLVF